MKMGIPDQFADVIHVLPSSPNDAMHAVSPWTHGRVEAEFVSTMTGFRTIKIPNRPERLVAFPGVMNQERPSLLGGPPDWVVVLEGINAISILGELLPQDA